MIVEISLATIAVCFVLLFVCALILTINALFTLKKVNKFIELDVGLLVEEATQTVNCVKEITRHVKDEADSLFKATCTCKQKIKEVNLPDKNKLNAGDWLDLAGQGLLIWQKIKQRNR